MRMTKTYLFLNHVNRPIFIALLISVLLSNITYAQTDVTDTIPSEAQVSIADVSVKHEALIESLIELDEEDQIPVSISIIDSSYLDFSHHLDSLRSKTVQDSSRFTLSIISGLLNEWEGYNERYREWQDEISEHLEVLKASRDTIKKKEKIWAGIFLQAQEKGAPDFILTKIISAQDTILVSSESVKSKTLKLVRLQEEIMAGITKTDDVIGFLKESRTYIKGKLFAINSAPIWQWNTEKSTVDLYAETRANFADQERVLEIFFHEHLSDFLFHTISFIFLIILFLLIRKKYKDTDFPGDDIQLRMALITIKSPFLAALTIGVVLSMYFYQGAPDIVNYTLVLIILFPTLYFFPRFVQFHQRNLLLIFIAVFYIDRLQELIVVDGFLSRILQLVKAISAFVLILMAYKAQRSISKTENKIWHRIVKGLLPIFMVFIVLSFVTNIFGAYQLSELLIEGVLTSTLFAVIFMVTGVVASSLLVVSLRSKFVSNLKVFSGNGMKFEQRMTALFYLFATMLWIKVMLKSFQLLDPVLNLYQEFVELSWIVGSLTISVGGILSFIVILLVTFLIAKLIKELVNDQIIPTGKSAKGLPNAFSMVFRYLVVTLGVYVALAAVGVNLSEFGLMAGALGVGLGFGLQNILHNLVSGLIVSFERPIHVGDTVEVANLTGIVTEIGVRSSKIRTYDGSEVILPNGDLLSKQVINWTLSDQKRRLEIKIRSSYDADPHEVIEILSNVLKENERILQTPAPMSLFEGYGDSALNFKVLFWVPLDIGLSTKSQVALSIYDKLKEKNIEAPIHQQRLLYQDSPPHKKPM